MQVDKQNIVIIAVHNDIWGLMNANQMIHEVQKHGLTPVLVVSKTGIDSSTKRVKSHFPALEPVRHLKETVTMEFMDWVDTLSKINHDGSDRLMTFKEMAERYCADGKVHYVNTGRKLVDVFRDGHWVKEKGGGQAIEDLITHLEGENKTVRMLLSLDVIALLTDHTVNTLGCFSTHPGLLTTGGMRASLRERQARFENLNGCVFRHGSFLDDPTRLRYHIEVPYDDSMPLLDTRALVFEKTVGAMVDHLPELLSEADAIKQGTSQANASKPLPQGAPETGEAHAMDWFIKSDGHHAALRAPYEARLARFLPSDIKMDKMPTELREHIDQTFNEIKAARDRKFHKPRISGDGGEQNGVGLA